MKRIFIAFMALSVLFACKEKSFDEIDGENLKSGKANGQASYNFTEISSLNIGGSGAAEISAFDPLTQKLFIVNNTVDDDDNVILNQIDVVDFSNPTNPQKMDVINIGVYGGKVNCVDVSRGVLAAAIESDNKTDNGKVVFFTTDDYSEVAVVEVGALPDMVTYSKDGKLLLSANEGEPDNDYLVDPVGSVSIIDVMNGYSVITLDFSSFESMQNELEAQGLRIFGLNASFAQDIEPEYIAVSENSKKAWVSLQENNAIAEIDLNSKSIIKIMPLGFKNYNLPENKIDPSDKDNMVSFNQWPVFGMYQPDGIAVLSHGNVPFIFSANEGDSRDYSGYSEEIRVGDVDLNPVNFPDPEYWLKKENLGRLHITNTLGDTDGDGEYEKLYSFGARSFSIWNGNTGKQIYDSEDFLDKSAYEEGDYSDNRSDDKGVEPEGVEIGRIANKNILFVGMERANAVAVYDVTNPVKPSYLQWLKTGTGPEGLCFITADESPNGKSILVVSSEVDGYITVYSN